MNPLEQIEKILNTEISFLYYNLDGLLIAVPTNNIKNEKDGYTRLLNKRPEFSWIKTSDLKNTPEEANSSDNATFLQ